MKIVVLGGGESGVGAALLGQKQGFEVFVSDHGSIKPEFKKELESAKIPYEEGKHSWELIKTAKEVIKSPGIPDKVAIVRKIKGSGIPVIGEIEFAARYTDAKIIAITGSNGKTTTTLLTYHLLKSEMEEVVMGGNVGTSFARNVAFNNKAIHVLELSSFQLDGIQTFRPDIGMLLNITPDHLDRYEYKMELYIASKFRICKNQLEEDLFIYNEEDQNIDLKIGQPTIKAQKKAINSKYCIEGRLNVGGLNFDLRKTVLQGNHNVMNALFAIETALYLGLQPAKIQAALESFRNHPHRMEFLPIQNGVTFINDSKATNVDATFFALEAMLKPTIWIVGGQDKGNDYQALRDLVSEKVKGIICMGVNNSRLLENFKGLTPLGMEEAKSAKEAVRKAKLWASEGDVVLLSPACASFDLFKNYIDRGDQFRAAVLENEKE